MTSENICANDTNIFSVLGEKISLLGFACIIAMAFLVTADVVLRLVFNAPISGNLELEEAIMALLVFSSFAFVQNGKSHIRVDILVSLFPAWVRKSMETFSWIMGGGLYLLMARQLFSLARTKYLSGEHTAVLEIPVCIFQGIAAVCVLVFALVILSQAIRELASLLQQKKYLCLFAVCFAVLAIGSWPWWHRALGLSIGRAALGGAGMAFMLSMLFMGVPIAYAMGITWLTGMLTLNLNVTAAFSSLGLSSYSYSTSFVFSVIPMFCLMGEIALHSGLSRDLFNAASKWLGGLPGGLGIAGVAGCAGFAAVSGESLATALTMSSVAQPEMRAKKYDPAFACATLAAGGTLGILIPPSIGFIFYAIITEESVGRLFIAGVVPGLLLTSLFMGVIYATAVVCPHKAPRGEKSSFREKLLSLKGIIGILLLVFLIMGGILSGTCTPTEGGAVGAVGALGIALAQRRLSWEGFKESVVAASAVTSKLMLILISVNLLGFFLAATRIPIVLADFFATLETSRYVILMGIMLFYIALGCMMNAIPMMLLTLPSLYPTILALGFDPIWFGVVVVILVEMGLITPPVGINVFAINSVTRDVPMSAIFKNVLPFFLAMAGCVLIITIFPQLATWLPDFIFGQRSL
jgi:tripartite ATP-independent transporter DctM subunit